MNYFLLIALFILAYMSAWFLLATIKKRNDLADIAWGLGFVLVAWLSLLIAGQTSPRTIGVSGLVSLWGLRLAWHIYRRNRGKTEDYRYAAWRQQWGKWFFLRSYLQVFLLQGCFMYLISIPVLLINRAATPEKLTCLDYVGLLVWGFGFFFETVGDRQLRQFIANPANKGQLMQTGLWRYSRHPNYFGEITMWWGIWLLALSVPGGLIGILGPLTITILITQVSGIPLLEKKYAGRADFEEYKRRTSVLIPRPPRKK